MLNENRKAILAYISVCIIWGSTYVAIKFAVNDLPPLLSAGVRFLVAGLLMFLVAAFKGKPRPDKLQVKNQSIIGLALILGGNGLVVIGSQWLSPGIVSLLFSTVPIFVATGQMFFLKTEKLNSRGWLGLILGFFGVTYLVVWGGDSLNMTLKGTLIIMAAVAFWAMGTLLSNLFKRESAIEYDQAIQMFAGGLGLFIAGLFAGEFQGFTLTLPGVLAIAYLIFIGSLLGFNSYVYLLRVWPPARASTYTYINPLVAIFLGFLFFRDPLNVHIFVGTAVILFGVFLVQFTGKK